MSAPQTSRWRRSRRVLVRGALLIGAVMAVVLAIDIGAFAAGLRRVGYGSERFYSYSPALGLDHRPHARGAWYAYKDGTRTHVSINSHGFPDIDRTIAKNRPRIALLGDGTAAFWEVEREQRAQHVMERMLNGEVEVLNFALRGAGTDQEFIRYTTQVVQFSPDIAVLLICVNNFAINVMTGFKPYFVLDSSAPGGIRLEGVPVRAREAGRGFSARRLLEHSFTLRTLKYSLLGVETHFRDDGPLDEHFELRPFKQAYDAEDDRRLELFERLLAAFASYSREKRIRLLVVEGLYRPALDEAMRRRVVSAYGDRFDFDKVSKLLAQHGATAGYEFLSLPRLVRERALDVRRLMHAEDTTHLNAEGVRVFASAVIEKLRDLGWLENGAEWPPVAEGQ